MERNKKTIKLFGKDVWVSERSTQDVFQLVDFIESKGTPSTYSLGMQLNMIAMGWVLSCHRRDILPSSAGLKVTTLNKLPLIWFLSN